MSSFINCRTIAQDQWVGLANDAYAQTEFSVTCAAKKIYLLLSDVDDGSRSLHPMQEGSPDHWRLGLDLTAGNYRYHYFADHGGLITYMRPDEADDAPRQMDGFDAELNVPLISQQIACKSDSHRAHLKGHRENNVPPCVAITLLQEQGA